MSGAKKLSQAKLNIIYSVCAIALMWVVWIIAYFAEGNDYVIPSFRDTFAAMFSLFGGAEFWRAFGMTMLRTLISFVLSFALAAVLSSLAAASRPFGGIMRPVVAVLRSIPTMAIILILLLWTSPTAAPVVVSFLVAFPMVYSQFMAAFGGIDVKLTEMAKVYGVPAPRRILKIYVPAVLPNILSQVGAVFSLTLKVMVSAEVMARTYVSIGGMMQDAKNFLEISELFALTLVTVIVGGLLEWALSKLTLLTRRWTGASSGQNSRRTAESAENGVGKEGGVDRV